MGRIKIQKDAGGIPGLCVIEPAVHGDGRGYFFESYSARDLAAHGIGAVFVQDNQSMSVKGVLRGLHFQKRHPQAKLVRVIRGEVFDVAVDLRPGSAAFGRWHGEILSAENRRQMFIPRGFAHGFLVLSDEAEFCYKCDDFYDPDDEGGLAWNDPDVGIEWPRLTADCRGTAGAEGCAVDGAPLILSEKDRKWPGIRDVFTVKITEDS